MRRRSRAMPAETSAQVLQVHLPAPGKAAPSSKPGAAKVAKAVAPPVRKARAAVPKPAERDGVGSAQDLDRLTRRLEADWQTALRKHEQAVHRRFTDLRAA